MYYMHVYEQCEGVNDDDGGDGDADGDAGDADGHEDEYDAIATVAVAVVDVIVAVALDSSSGMQILQSTQVSDDVHVPLNIQLIHQQLYLIS